MQRPPTTPTRRLRQRRPASPRARLAGAALLLLLGCVAAAVHADGAAEQGGERPKLPHIVLITVDTLRADRLSAYGNPAPTSPNLDALLARGARFDNARTVEPLTAPAAASMLTSLHPHEHGTSRNGIPVREGLRSLPTLLARLGYTTTAFVSNWTLADKQSGLAAHFDVYREVLTRKRWLFWFGESDAEAVRTEATAWLEREGVYPGTPLLLWAHFVDPHAPYELREAFAPRLGLDPDGPASAVQRYDTEIAAVDHAVGLLLQDLRRLLGTEEILYVFAADHGEGLGEHGYKGHGRRLYEEELRIPLAFTWPGRIPPSTLQAPASLLDLAPTILGLLGAPHPPEWRGYDWSRELLAGEDGPLDRALYFQAHKGVALRAAGNQRVAENKRRKGLLRLAYVQGGRKWILDVDDGRLRSYGLSVANGMPARYAGSENAAAAAAAGPLPEPLRLWKARVKQGLAERDREPPPALSEEALEMLQSLGYTH